MVGSRTSRQRNKKPATGQPVRPARQANGEPPVMWPGAGSGFEADPFSPAGSVQRQGLLVQGLARRRGGRAVRWMLVGVVVILPFAYLLSLVVHHL